MKINRIILTIFTVFLLSLSVLASDVITAKEELFFDGASLADFAEVENKPDIIGYSAYVLNLNSGAVMFEKNCNEPVYPASTVKLMTAIVAYENIDNLDEMVIAADDSVRIDMGKTYSAKDLLHALLISGDNAAAVSLACHVSSSEMEFCKLMNDKAKEIGAENTNFNNVTGYDDASSITTARDMGLIAQYFYYIPQLFDISDMTRYNESETLNHILVNRNFLLSRASTDEYFYASASGMSVGSTENGGQCIISTTVSDDGMIYLAVVMNSKEIDGRNKAYDDIVSLFDFCKKSFSYKTVASVEDSMCEIEVNNATDVDHIALFPSQDIKMLLPNDLDYAKDIYLEKRIFTESADAPVNRFDVFGEVVVKYKNKVAVGRANLVSDVELDKSNVLYFFSRIEKIVKGKWFTAFIITASVLFVIYFGLSVHYKYFRKSKYTGKHVYRK